MGEMLSTLARRLACVLGDRDAEWGRTTIVAGLLMVPILATAAFAIDVGKIYMIQAELQTAADAASIAAVRGLPDPAAARAIAIDYIDRNSGDFHSSGDSASVVVGAWDMIGRTFDPGGVPSNAVQVTTVRSAESGNPVVNAVAQLLGSPTADVSATAISITGSSTIDFEGVLARDGELAVGAGRGISGDGVSGSVNIHSATGLGPAVIDGVCGAGAALECTGRGAGLVSGQGAVLVISGGEGNAAQEVLDEPCPTASGSNDAPTFAADAGDITADCTLVLDFEGLGNGLATLTSLTLVDVERDAFVWLYHNGLLVDEVRLDTRGAGIVTRHLLRNEVAFDLMVVKLTGRGAVDDIGFTHAAQLVG